MKEIRLSNPYLTVSVVPEAGGKITSLRAGGGREWLWRNPHLPLMQPVYGASYVETMDSGGWDEVFPSVSPAILDGMPVPDHGDLVGLPWAVEEHLGTSLRLSARARFADCVFERTLVLDGPRLRVAYRLHNRGQSAIPYLWCAHPLIALEPGMRIVLPAGTPVLNRGGIAVDTADFAWPVMRDGRGLEHIPDPDRAGFQPCAIKMFTSASSVDGVVVVAPDGRESLGFSWDADRIPHLGMWLNLRAWSGCGSPPYFNLGLEPATAPFDSLTDAAAAGAGRSLPGGASDGWEFYVSRQHTPA